jgi:peptide-methionine (S)-S-oxide reductase
MPGYAGGTVPNPTYEQVCGGDTGHAEVTRIEYDPALVTYDKLLTVFFATHDPTTPNRQGNDVGPQYRSIVMYTTPEQQGLAEKFIANLNVSHSEGAPVITEVKPLDTFYSAEDYHQRYYERNKTAPYCQLVINPKLKKLQETFSELIKDSE